MKRLLTTLALVPVLAACPGDGSDGSTWHGKTLRITDTGYIDNVSVAACGDGELIALVDEYHPEGPTLARLRLVNGAIERVVGTGRTTGANFSFLSSRIEIVGDRAYLFFNSNDVRVWSLATEAPTYLGRYFSVPGVAYLISDGDHIMLHANPTEGRIVDVTDPNAPVVLLQFRLREGTTVTGVFGGARRGDDLVLLAANQTEFHRFSWSDVMAARERPNAANIILEDHYPVVRTTSAFERRSPVFDGTYMVANVFDDPSRPPALTDALPAVIDPATGELRTDRAPDGLQGNNPSMHHEFSAYVQPEPRGGEWFQIGPGLTGLWEEIVHVELESMLDGVSANDGVAAILPQDALFYTDLCWFPDQQFGYVIREDQNNDWTIGRWE